MTLRLLRDALCSHRRPRACCDAEKWRIERTAKEAATARRSKLRLLGPSLGAAASANGIGLFGIVVDLEMS